MSLLAKILIIFIALEHLYIVYFEMFAWDTVGRKIFRQFPKEFFPKTKILAANQGLYNAFLVAGLIWSLLIKDITWSKYVALFFVSCVAAAGIYGGLTATKRIFFTQGVPAIITLLVILLL